MSNQINRTASDISRDYALELFTSLAPEDQAAIIALAAALASPQ